MMNDRQPMRVTPEAAVPRLIVEYSRITVPSPTSTQVSSPRYLRSCGSPPTMEPCPTRTPAPSRALRSIVARGPIRQHSPRGTPGPPGGTARPPGPRPGQAFPLGDHLALDERHALEPAGPAAELDHLHLGADQVAGEHRAAELHVVERHEVHHLVLAALQLLHEQHPADLGH